ncbi:hypothetical protein KW783_00425 [Candidatus Parcubacteria bacterium]|nr:hypothetical protein [Candidatus Parcubacteria bacterium]
MDDTQELKTGGGNTALVVFIIGLIIGFAVGAYWHKWRTDSRLANQANNNGSELGTSTNTGTTSTGITGGLGGLTFGTDPITVEDQDAGNTVTISNANFDKVSWIAIRDDQNGSYLGNILGAQRVASGNHDNIKITLLRATKPVTKYHVIVYVDNGDMTLSTKTDAPLEQDGKVLDTIFMTK